MKARTACTCGHDADEHDPAPADAPDAYGACAVCDCEEYRSSQPEEEPMTSTEPVTADPAQPVEVSPELALAIRDERETAVQPGTTLPSPREWEATMAIAKQIAATPFVPTSYRGQPEAVVAAILTGRELGIGPMQALRDIHMIDGRPAFSAQLMLAKMRAGGVVIVESQSTAERAWIKARRSDTGEQGEFEFTIQDAEAAKLLGKSNWQTYRSDMLWARAVSRMARRFGSDLLGGLVYSKEELDDLDDDGYGGDPGYEATTARAFDAATDLLPSARRDRSAKKVGEALKADQQQLAGNLDWTLMLEQAAETIIGPRDGWEKPQRDEFMHRWPNTIAKLTELAEASPEYHPDLGIKAGPEGDALIVAAFEFGFGVTLALPLPTLDDDVIEGEATEVPDGE